MCQAALSPTGFGAWHSFFRQWKLVLSLWISTVKGSFEHRNNLNIQTVRPVWAQTPILFEYGLNKYKSLIGISLNFRHSHIKGTFHPKLFTLTYSAIDPPKNVKNWEISWSSWLTLTHSAQLKASWIHWKKRITTKKEVNVFGHFEHDKQIAN